MRPIPPAPFLPNLGEVLRKATEEGIRQGLELIRQEEEEEALAKIKREREDSPEGLFIAPDERIEMSTGAARTSLSSGPYTGLQSAKKNEAVPKIKREREDSVEDLFVAPHHGLKMTTGAPRTTLSSGPYAGLQSARKRVRETVAPEEESKPSFGPPKKRVHETVDPDEESKPTFGPPKKVVKKGGALKNVQIINSRTTQQGVEWYDKVDAKQPYARGDLQDLKYLLTLVKNASKDALIGKDTTQSMSKIRQRLQQMEFYPSLSPILIKKSGLLDDEGLPLIFQNRAQGVYFPTDIVADADILYRKWMSGQIDPHLFRGIVTKTGTGKEERGFKSHSIDKEFPGRITCNYVGAGNLVNGQWWPLQLCAKRDGAHGEVEKGIHGQKGQGAYSVVLSGGGYANVDTGNLVKYCGTQGVQNSPSPGTSLLLKSYETQQPLRLLRSASLPANNTYRPARGLRYDGLYRITSYEILDEKTAMHRFSLSRLGGQDPIRYSGEGMIPSNAQILELNKIREQLG